MARFGVTLLRMVLGLVYVMHAYLALAILVAGITVVGVLAVAVAAHDADRLDRVLVATLALLAMSSFDAVFPLPAAARELSSIRSAGRRIVELTEREPSVVDPPAPLPAPPSKAVVALEDVTARYASGERPALRSPATRFSTSAPLRIT